MALHSFSKGHLLADNFSSVYFYLHHVLYNEAPVVESRNGTTHELLNFKTEIIEPQKRCVMGSKRDANIFFLLAEALWIWAGRKDVEFLDIFNGQMKEYSDDGIAFHAPYGFRLRNWGVDSFGNDLMPNGIVFQGKDQISEAVNMLAADPGDRRVVLSVWNPDLDLNVKSKDLPCNDIVMLKIREGKLHTTIANRSNDIDWGLTTNLFQFSIVSEFIAACLGVEIGTQTHNSQSLHLYMGMPLTHSLETEYKAIENLKMDYYKAGVTGFKFNFDFSSDQPDKRREEIDFHVKNMIFFLGKMYKNPDWTRNDDENMYFDKLGEFSPSLEYIFNILSEYIQYKHHKDRLAAVRMMMSMSKFYNVINTDFAVLSVNFFMSRMFAKDRETHEVVRSFFNTHTEFNFYDKIRVGKL